MKNRQDTQTDLSDLNLDKLTIGGQMSVESSQSPPPRGHPQISSEVQARLMAFQKKRIMQIPTDRPNDDPSNNKPLPPLPKPVSQVRSLSTNDALDSSAIPSIESKVPSYKVPSFAPTMGTQIIGRLPKSSSPQQQVQKFELTKKSSLSQRRGMKLNIGDISTPSSSGSETPTPISPPVKLSDSKINSTGELSRRLSERKNKPNFKLNLGETGNSEQTGSDLTSLASSTASATVSNDTKPQLQGLFANYSKYVDIKSGSLNFAGKASLHSKGVDFSSGSSFRISIDELEFLEELGHGNYGTVSKVLHKPTGVLMAMKEVRLELDETKFMQILMELEILHKCDSSYIVDFYGAFFVEGAVYMCMEYMDGGSLDKIYGTEGISDEACLAYITESVIMGLKALKDQHNIIHRDVKPTNILVNTAGKVKLCDFGVSGNLVASLARTNIGCQSYMAPERIKSLSPDDATYSVQSDIWSLGLTILEVAAGHYPYPSETYDNIFSQLSAIVDGEPPVLDRNRYSKEAQAFIKSCLNKNPDLRPSYGTLLKHPWLQKYKTIDPHMDVLVTERVEKIEEEKERKGLSRSNSLSNPPSNKKSPDNVQSLLKNKVKAPALHRGGLFNSNKSFSRN